MLATEIRLRYVNLHRSSSMKANIFDLSGCRRLLRENFTCGQFGNVFLRVLMVYEPRVRSVQYLLQKIWRKSPWLVEYGSLFPLSRQPILFCASTHKTSGQQRLFHWGSLPCHHFRSKKPYRVQNTISKTIHIAKLVLD